MSQQFWKKVLPFAFVLAFLVACSEDETQSSSLGENDSQSETDIQTEEGTQNEHNAQSDEENDSESENANQFDLEAEDETDYEQWNIYENMRFAYSIYYPSSWIIGEQSQNGDGVSLYEGDPDNDIRIYGSLYDADLYDPYSDASKDGFTTDKITLNNGDEADYLVGMEDGKVLFKVIFTEDYVVYTFYANVTVDFFDENVDLLVQTAKSLDVKKLE